MSAKTAAAQGTRPPIRSDASVAKPRFVRAAYLVSTRAVASPATTARCSTAIAARAVIRIGFSCAPWAVYS
jgi:hypothetical protein